jgi:spore maturation protein CgeB
VFIKWNTIGVATLTLAILLFGAWALLSSIRREKALRQILAQNRSDSKKLKDIAGSVGRSAPIIRGIEETVEEIKGNTQEALKAIKAIPNPSTSRDEGSARETIATPIKPPISTPTRTIPKKPTDNSHAPQTSPARAVVTKIRNSAPTMHGKNNKYIRKTVHSPLLSGAAENEYIKLDKNQKTIRVNVTGAEKLTVRVSVSGPAAGRSGVFTVRVFDTARNEISFPTLPQNSDAVGRFSYLSTNGSLSDIEIPVNIPSNAAEVELGFRSWQSEPSVKNMVEIVIDEINPEWLKMRPTKEIKVAAILDEFSFNSFQPDCQLIEILPSNWREVFQAERPDIFLCESAWSGRDSELRPWQGRIYASENFSYENRKELIEILSYCEANKIPTVFWNKEDPSHYDDKKHSFVKTALKFDHIFTTDERSVPRYKLEHGHQSVHVLPFAVQPRVFNPIEPAKRTSDVIFAGGWYSNHAERSRDTKEIFDSVIESGKSLKIYDRFYSSNDSSHDFPDKYRELIHPSVPHAQVAQAYKESEYGITINTVKNSTTMFARRVFELMASNTIVLSNDSEGVRRFFGEGVIFPQREPRRLDLLSPQEKKKILENNLNLVLSEHTYAKRLEHVFEIAGIDFRQDQQKPALAFRATNLAEAELAWNRLVAASHWPGTRTIVLSSEVSHLDAGFAIQSWNRSGIRVIHEPSLISAKTDTRELMGDSKFIWVSPVSSNVPSIEFVERLMLHTQYVDAPITARDLDEGGYTFSQTSTIAKSFLVSNEMVNHFLTAASNNTTVLAYQV